MQYCSYCNKHVATKLSQNQILIGILLLFLTSFFLCIPGILYFVLAERQTCVTCGNPTSKIPPVVDKK